MRILCVCQQGNSRSWALAWMLKKRRHDALAVGVDSSSAATLGMLCEWAEVILVTCRECLERIPSEYMGKAVNYDVGPDRWGFSPSQNAIKTFDQLLQNDPWNASLPERER